MPQDTGGVTSYMRLKPSDTPFWMSRPCNVYLEVVIEERKLYFPSQGAVLQKCAICYSNLKIASQVAR